MKYKYSDVPHANIFADQSVLMTYQDLIGRILRKLALECMSQI